MHKVSFYANLILIIGSILFGYLYLLKPGLMDYHYAYLGLTEEEIIAINPHLYSLMLTFKKIIGGLFFAVSLFIAGLCLLKENRSDKVNVWVIFVAVSLATIPLTLLSYQVSQAIPPGLPRPPWYFSLAMLLIALISAFFTQFGKKKSD